MGVSQGSYNPHGLTEAGKFEIILLSQATSLEILWQKRK